MTNGESQYPLRRASSWRRSGRPVRQALMLVSQYPLRRASSWRRRYQAVLVTADMGLNTLSGGHPLGGLKNNNKGGSHGLSQYPLRRASSWRNSEQHEQVGTSMVSIPSQAGILLAEPIFSPTARPLLGGKTASNGHRPALHRLDYMRLWIIPPLSLSPKSLVQFFKVFRAPRLNTPHQAGFVTPFESDCRLPTPRR